MARPLVHRLTHKQERPGFQGGSEWACPFCPHQVVCYPLHHKVMVAGQADALHVRAMKEVPVHLDDIVLELTEADENWLTLWSSVQAPRARAARVAPGQANQGRASHRPVPEP